MPLRHPTAFGHRDAGRRGPDQTPGPTEGGDMAAIATAHIECPDCGQMVDVPLKAMVRLRLVGAKEVTVTLTPDMGPIEAHLRGDDGLPPNSA